MSVELIGHQWGSLELTVRIIGAHLSCQHYRFSLSLSVLAFSLSSTRSFLSDNLLVVLDIVFYTKPGSFVPSFRDIFYIAKKLLYVACIIVMLSFKVCKLSVIC